MNYYTEYIKKEIEKIDNLIKEYGDMKITAEDSLVPLIDEEISKLKIQKEQLANSNYESADSAKVADEVDSEVNPNVAILEIRAGDWRKRSRNFRPRSVSYVLPLRRKKGMEIDRTI
ncbi:MAG: hypothetical protein KatS3mg101_0474 [Patescibacteria group bacterium]|nr:MAG: hypothetical protein KatS3mg101_0474 [Patescibacteria group bacterium]